MPKPTIENIASILRGTKVPQYVPAAFNQEILPFAADRIEELEAENKELKRLAAHYRRGLDMIRHERSVELSNRAVLDTVYCIAVRFLLEGNTDEIRKKRD